MQHAKPNPLSEASDLEIEQAYARLRRIAAKLVQRERTGHTLWPTEVVHEAFARLLEQGSIRPGGKISEVISRAAHVMTQVLVDHARFRRAIKRGGGQSRISLEAIGDVEAAIERPDFDWVALDRALAELAANDPRRHSVVMLRFFGAMNNQQIARQLGLDERTVGRDWTAARLWLQKRMRDSGL